MDLAKLGVEACVEEYLPSLDDVCADLDGVLLTYCAAALAGSKVYVFGGRKNFPLYTDSARDYLRSYVYILDTVMNTWTGAKPEGYLPVLSAPTASLWNDLIVIIGGKGVFFYDLILNCIQFHKNTAGYLEGHTTNKVSWEKSLIVFGGVVKRNHEVQRRINTPRLRMSQNSNKVRLFDPNSIRYVVVPVKGESPGAKAYHTSAAVQSNIIFAGGKRSYDAPLIELVVLEFNQGSSTYRWSKPLGGMNSIIPKLRTSYSITNFHGKLLLLLDSQVDLDFNRSKTPYIYESERDKWTQVVTNHGIRRNQHYAQISLSNSLLIIGGSGNVARRYTKLNFVER